MVLLSENAGGGGHSGSCADPNCSWPVGSGSERFCCEKCEGRFNGEEWAIGGNRAHTKGCPSRNGQGEAETTPSWEQSSGRGWQGREQMQMAPIAWRGAQTSGGCGHGYGPSGGRQQRNCVNPQCQYPANSDPACEGFCCEKCGGRFKGEDWAFTTGAGTRAHTKMCASRDKHGQWAEEAPQTGFMASGSGFMPSGGGGMAPTAWRPPLPGGSAHGYGPYSGGGFGAAASQSQVRGADDQKLKSYEFMIQSLKEQLVAATSENRALKQEVQRLRPKPGGMDELTGAGQTSEEKLDMDDDGLEEILETEKQALVEAAQRLMVTQQAKLAKLETGKQIAISGEDFDEAKKMKQEIDALQAELSTSELIASASSD